MTKLTLEQVLTLLQDRTEELHQTVQTQHRLHEQTRGMLARYQAALDEGMAQQRELLRRSAVMLRLLLGSLYISFLGLPILAYVIWH